MGSEEQKQIMDELLLGSAYVLLRKDSIDWNDKTGEFYHKKAHIINIYSSRYTAESSMGVYDVYSDTAAWYRYMPLIGEIPAHKEDGALFDILDFLYFINKNCGIDELEYEYHWMEKVEIKSILSYYNYDNSQILPKAMRINLCNPYL